MLGPKGVNLRIYINALQNVYCFSEVFERRRSVESRPFPEFTWWRVHPTIRLFSQSSLTIAYDTFQAECTPDQPHPVWNVFEDVLSSLWRFG